MMKSRRRAAPSQQFFRSIWKKPRTRIFWPSPTAIKQQLGRLDGILHNAALLFNLTPLESQTLDQWQSLLRVNLIAPFALTRACLALLKARRMRTL